MEFLMLQIAIFVIFIAGIGLVTRKLGKYRFPFLLGLTLAVLLFAVFISNGVMDRPLAYVLLSGVVCLAAIIRQRFKARPTFKETE